MDIGLIKRIVKSFVEKAIYGKKPIMTKSDEIVLLGYEDNFQKKYSFQNGGAKTLLAEHKLLESYEVVFCWK